MKRYWGEPYLTIQLQRRQATDNKYDIMSGNCVEEVEAMVRCHMEDWKWEGHNIDLKDQ
jgi:hypothetical protein